MVDHTNSIFNKFQEFSYLTVSYCLDTRVRNTNRSILVPKANILALLTAVWHHRRVSQLSSTHTKSSSLSKGLSFWTNSAFTQVSSLLSLPNTCLGFLFVSYQVGHHRLVCGTPAPKDCELYYVDKDALFSYHALSEVRYFEIFGKKETRLAVGTQLWASFTLASGKIFGVFILLC